MSTHDMTKQVGVGWETEFKFQNIRNLHARRERVFSTMPLPFYPQKTPVPAVQGARFVLGAGLEGYGKFRAHRDLIPRT